MKNNCIHGANDPNMCTRCERRLQLLQCECGTWFLPSHGNQKLCMYHQGFKRKSASLHYTNKGSG